MAGRKCLQRCTVLCTICMLCWVSALAADEAQSNPAGATRKAKITDVQFLKLSPAPRPELLAPTAKAKLVYVIPEVSFLLAIKGKDLPCTHTPEVQGRYFPLMEIG